MRLLLATNNPGKLEIMKKGLVGIPCRVLSSHELGLDVEEVEETGSTLEENAKIKAHAFFKALKEKGLEDVAVLSDDGGLQIDALNGEPGIYARRWAGENASDEEIIAYTMKRMDGVPKDDRTARFTVYLVLILPDGTEHVVTGSTEGWISVDSPVTTKTKGLPYGALLVVSVVNKRLEDLTIEEWGSTHRAIALGKIRDIISNMSS
ncbi:MAG: non-canonical purine NTP pyrophosphatase [Patescibacteria group bacterium]|nr:hypothetical protein [Patescibacteria group bacterium]MBU2508984.1 hypothetical protein [Patescibacteria group bacterium]